MTLVPYDFTDQSLRRLSICAIIPDAARVDRYRETEIECDAQDAAGHWYHLIVNIGQTKSEDVPKEHLHVHLDVVKAMGSEKSPPTSSLEAVFDELAKLYGNIGVAHVDGEYSLPKTTLPKHGIIMSMSGIATSAAGENLSLTGVRMSFDQSPDQSRDQPLFDELTWRYRGDDVIVSIDAFTKFTLDERIVVSTAAFLDDGIQKFVLGKTKGS